MSSPTSCWYQLTVHMPRRIPLLSRRYRCGMELKLDQVSEPSMMVGEVPTVIAVM